MSRAPLPPAVAPGSQPLHRLRRLSRWVRWLSLLAVPVLVSTPLLVWLAPERLIELGLTEMAGLNLKHLSQDGLTMAVRSRMAIVTLLPVGLGLALLWQLWALFGEYLHGNVFGSRALTCMRRFATLLFALSLAEPAARALMSMAISWDNPPGQRQLVVTIDSTDYALVLGALVFMAIARVMTEAARVAEENEGFV